MPVRPAGPRLFSSIKMKVLGTKSGSAGGERPSNVFLNLTPFVDMMTILVTFLLMVFGGSELLQAQAGLELPTAMNKDTLQLAPVIVVQKREVTYQGELIGLNENLLREDTLLIEALKERLVAADRKIKEDIGFKKLPKDLEKACEDVAQGIRPEKGKFCPDGLVILQADESTDARLITKIVATAQASGFVNLLFAVKNKS